jgi:hypothetical protein
MLAGIVSSSGGSSSGMVLDVRQLRPRTSKPIRCHTQSLGSTLGPLRMG